MSSVARNRGTRHPLSPLSVTVRSWEYGQGAGPAGRPFAPKKPLQTDHHRANALSGKARLHRLPDNRESLLPQRLEQRVPRPRLGAGGRLRPLQFVSDALFRRAGSRTENGLRHSLSSDPRRMAMREWTRPRPMAGSHFEDRRNSRPSRNPAIAKPTKAVSSPIEPPTLRSTPIAGFRRRATLAPYRHDRTLTRRCADEKVPQLVAKLINGPGVGRNVGQRSIPGSVTNNRINDL